MRRILGLAIFAVIPGVVLGQVSVYTPTLQPPPAAPGRLPNLSAIELRPEQFQSFDPSRVRLSWTNRRWQLVTETGELLKDFGSQDQDARLALQLIQELGLNQRAVIGEPVPILEYWLVDGQAPRGLPRSGMRVVTLVPAALEVADVLGQWVVRDKARIYFNFGPRAEEARQALAVIRKYQFDQVAYLGRVTPSMYLFFSQATPNGSASLTVERSGRALPSPKFSRLAKNSDGSPRTSQLPQATSNLSLAGVAAPVLPPLSNRRDPEPTRSFHWQSKPGHSVQVTENADRLPFDWRRATVVQEEGEWRLKVGTQVLARFGSSANHAQQAMAALRYYRFTEQNRLGGEQPYFTYYLANNQSPRGVMMGVNAERFDPDKVEVRQVGENFALCQGQRVLVQLRQQQDDARKLLESIQRNKYDRLCRIGDPGKEAMTFLVRSR